LTVSYSIWIGEARLDEADEGDMTVSVRHEDLEKAPSLPHDEMTGRTNGRHPAYSGWSEFCDSVGLRKLFFDTENGLMRHHPGCFALKRKHHQVVVRALKQWRKRYPLAEPGFGPTGLNDGVLEDCNLARLVWLEWWMGWALENCKQPAVENY